MNSDIPLAEVKSAERAFSKIAVLWSKLIFSFVAIIFKRLSKLLIYFYFCPKESELLFIIVLYKFLIPSKNSGPINSEKSVTVYFPSSRIEDLQSL
jgi:hypothetical protein